MTITRRHKLIGGVFCIVGSAWAVDLLTGQPGPDQANANPAAILAGPAPATPVETPEDLDSLIESLEAIGVPPVPLALDRATRDLFVPTNTLKASLQQASSSQNEQPEGPQPLPFERRHQLQGVLMGRVPLALIDGELLRRGAIIDGHRLVEIRRDYVILEADGIQLTLPLTPAGER